MDRPHTPEHMSAEAALAALGQQHPPPPYDYAGFQARVARARERAALVQKLGVASLAGVGLAIVALLLVTGRPQSGDAIAAPGAESLPVAAAPHRIVDERWLIALPAEPAVVRGSTRVPVTALEDRIAWLDDSLSAALQEPASQSEVRRLHAERRQLVDALVRVRYAEHLSTQFN